MKIDRPTDVKIHPELQAFADELKANGFTIFFYTPSGSQCTDMHFEKGEKIGYVHQDYYKNGWNFGTVNKPCHYQGTGYRLLSEVPLTIENAEKTLAAPLICNFVSNKGRSHTDSSASVKAYASADEYMNKDSILEYWYY